MGTVLVLGATGLTGRLVAHEVVRRGLDVVLGARNPDKLAVVVAELDADVEARVCTPTDPDALEAAFEGVDVVINTIGPFTDLGEPVVRTAIERGVHYLDTTGEQIFMKRMLDRWHARAEDKGLAVVCAHAFEFALGDCAATVAIDALGGRADVVRIFYTALGGYSHGTAKSAARVIGNAAYTWRNGALVREGVAKERIRVELPPRSRPASMVSIPGGESLHVPRRHDVGTVVTYMQVPRRTTRIGRVTRPLMPILGWRPVQRLADKLIDRNVDPPDEATRRDAPFQVVAEAQRGDEVVRCRIQSRDAYGLTAVIIADGAQTLLASPPRTAGVVSTAMAFDPRAFLDRLRDHDLVWDCPAPLVIDAVAQSRSA